MIYHLLPEAEVFSAYRGGAIAKNIANIMRYDDSRIVVCQSADDTWSYGKDRILEIPNLLYFSKIRGRRHLPIWVVSAFLRHAFRPLLTQLKAGDIVWCHNQPFFAASLAKMIHSSNAKLIYHSHDGSITYGMHTAFNRFTADAYIYVSEYLRQRWIRLFPYLKNTYAIHNGIDNKVFYPNNTIDDQNNKVPTVLCVGRLIPEKGIHVLIKAMTILNRRGIKANCRVIGSSFSGGSKKTFYIKKLLAGCPSNVQFAGYCVQTQIANEYRAADILCCPSIWQEPFGNTNIEAMACGVPVVATKVGGIPEIAVEGGVLLVKSNSAIDLANALQNLIVNRDLRIQVGKEGLKSVRHHFTWEMIYTRYKHVSDSLIQREVRKQ